MGNAPSELSMVSVTSARPNGARPEVPAKMTSSILPPRRSLAPWVPMTHRSASSTFDLPDPLGPTTQVMPGSKRRLVADAKDLKPLSVKLFKCSQIGPFPTRILSSRSAEASADRMMLQLAQVRNVVGGPRRGTGDIRLDIRSRLGVGTAPCPFSVDSSTRRLADSPIRRPVDSPLPAGFSACPTPGSTLDEPRQIALGFRPPLRHVVHPTGCISGTKRGQQA